MLCQLDNTNNASLKLSPHFWLKFWKLKIPYKFQIFIWKGLHNGVPVKDRIFHHMDSSHQNCVMCSAANKEDLDLLLLHCSFAQDIWRYFFPIGFTSMMQHSTFLSWVQSWQSKDSLVSIYNTPITIHVIACIMHNIWKHRCRVIFNNLTPNTNSIIHQINHYIARHHLDINFDHVSRSITVRSSVHSTWKPPPFGVMKVNIDVAFSPPSLLAVIGIITRSHAGQYVMGKGIVKRAINIHQSESWDLTEAMKLAKYYGWNQVIFETDNLNISSYLHQQSMSHWQSVPLLKRCVNLCANNSVWSCVFVNRECNKVADAVAKAARKHSLCGEWWLTPPDVLISHIDCDINNLTV